MITSLFRKSTPLNYSIVIIGMIAFAGAYYSQAALVPVDNMPYLFAFVKLVLLFAAIFITNFVAKKNAMSKDSAYTALFCVLLFAIFPAVFLNVKLLFAQFFVLLSLRRLVSLHTMKSAKEKLFDASLWIFVASLFYFWSILFLVLVYISILFHTARDYRTWFLPALAFVTVSLLYLFAAYFWNPVWIDNLEQHVTYSTHFTFDTQNTSDLLLLIYFSVALFSALAMSISLANRPLLQHSSYKKVLSALVLAFAVYGLAPHKSSEIAVFSISPLAIILTSQIEALSSKWQREVFLVALIIGAVVAFVLQL
ncbi:MAG: hypothetical protein FGM16_01190 [Flavobacterium sp.]|nr:hypothetical protein [Flavobacterium sp.]